MEPRSPGNIEPKAAGTNQRDAIRYPFAVDAVALDLDTFMQTTGVTSDLSMTGAFVCTNRPLSPRARVRVTLERKGEKVSALGLVRTVKTKVGMGVQFVELERNDQELLGRWVDQLRRVPETSPEK
jgi:hypothetical protein